MSPKAPESLSLTHCNGFVGQAKASLWNQRPHPKEPVCFSVQLCCLRLVDICWHTFITNTVSQILRTFIHNEGQFLSSFLCTPHFIKVLTTEWWRKLRTHWHRNTKLISKYRLPRFKHDWVKSFNPTYLYLERFILWMRMQSQKNQLI